MRKLRILIQNRSAAFIVPGGDTVVMQRLHDSVSGPDFEVDLHAGECDVRGYDLVHLVNLTIGEEARRFRANCIEAGVPYVLTALYEDWPRYVSRSLSTIKLFQNYLNSGSNQEQFASGLAELNAIHGGPIVGNREVVESAAAVFACAQSEASRLIGDYCCDLDRVFVVPFGADGLEQADPSLIARLKEQLGCERFALCCGRLETRKNQLMLLKAMEGDSLPLVFAVGTASVQAPYVELMRRSAEGRNARFVRNLDSATFSALMQAAAVHVLPSWFELPGLVSLEAAALGTPVVASSWGAIGDYLTPETSDFCEPNDPRSIRDAIHRALARNDRTQIQASVRPFTWARFGELTRAVYEQVLSTSASRPGQSSQVLTENSIHSIVSENPMNANTSSANRFDVSIVIPCFNRMDLTRDCIEAICTHDPEVSYEVIFVDNGSSDETATMLKAIEGDVKILRFSSNRGFAVACNQAARVAEGRYLVFLNNDTSPQAGWLDALVDSAKRSPLAGAVGGLLTYPTGGVQHAGLAFNDRKIPYHVFQNFASDHPAVTDERVMTALTAACMLVPAATFRELGGFDEGFVNGFEDVDFCLRLKAAGYACVYTPSCKVVHHEESSSGRKDHDRENLERFMSIWGSAIVSDEQELLAHYGLTITWNERGGNYGQLQAPPAVSTVQTLDAGSERLFDLAQSLYHDGDFRGAADALQKIVEDKVTLAREDQFETWQTLGNCLTRLSETVDAEKAYYEAIKLNGESERPYLGLGTIAMLEENWLAAQYSFMTALAKNSNAMKGEFGVGLSLAARNRHEAAVLRFERVLDNDPFNPEALFYLYRSAMESGKPEAALPYLETYVAEHPDDTNFLFNLCGAYWKSGQLTRAIETCKRVLQLDPNHAAADEIMAHFEKSLTVDA